MPESFFFNYPFNMGLQMCEHQMDCSYYILTTTNMIYEIINLLNYINNKIGMKYIQLKMVEMNNWHPSSANMHHGVPG